MRSYQLIGLGIGVFLLAALPVGLSWTRVWRSPPVSRYIAPAPVPSVARVTDFAVPVLMYHRICDLTEREARSPLMRDLTVAPAVFEAQMRYLVENGFTLLLAREVEEGVREGRALPEKAVAVTMDDGYKDNFEHAFPALRRLLAPGSWLLARTLKARSQEPGARSRERSERRQEPGARSRERSERRQEPGTRSQEPG